MEKTSSIRHNKEQIGGRVGYDVDNTKMAEYRQALHESENRFRTSDKETFDWINKIVESIDFDVLRSIFVDIAQRSTVLAENMNFVGKNDVHIVDPTYRASAGAIMGYEMEPNVLLIQGKEFARTVKQIPKDDAVATAYFTAIIAAHVLVSLAHEMSHATGFLRRSYVVVDDTIEAQQKAGLLIDKVRVGSQGRLLSHSQKNFLLNEAMADCIATRVAKEYLHRSPLNLPDGGLLNASTFEQITIAHKGIFLPPLSIAAQQFVENLSTHIARVCGIPDDSERVMLAIVRSVYSGADPYAADDGEKSLIDQTLGDNFAQMLSVAKNEKDLRRLIKKYKLPPLNGSMLQRWKNYLARHNTAEALRAKHILKQQRRNEKE